MATKQAKKGDIIQITDIGFTPGIKKGNTI